MTYIAQIFCFGAIFFGSLCIYLLRDYIKNNGRGESIVTAYLTGILCFFLIVTAALTSEPRTLQEKNRDRLLNVCTGSAQCNTGDLVLELAKGSK